VQRKTYIMKAKLYLEEVYKELTQKVSWPSRSELQNSAIVVMVASIIIAMMIFGMDFTFKKMMDIIYGLFY